MKIVADEMCGIKVGNILEKCKKLDSWTVGQKNQVNARSDDPAILQWILNFGFCICLEFGAWDLEFYRTSITVPTLSWFP
jgi:hypothetical protein